MKQLAVLLVFTLTFIYLNMQGPNKKNLNLKELNTQSDKILIFKTTPCVCLLCKILFLNKKFSTDMKVFFWGF